MDCWFRRREHALGSGKSTTGLSILRLVSPVSGTIHLDGENITNLDHEQLRAKRRRMQMISSIPLRASIRA